MDKFMQQMREAFANDALWKEFQTGIWDTIYSTVAATLVACVLGIILGIILVAGEEDGVRPLPGPVMKVLNFAINILRSVPFLILMIMVLPLSELLVGTTIGTVASIPPLIIASASFVARLVETSLREVDKGGHRGRPVHGLLPLPDHLEGDFAGEPALPGGQLHHRIYHHSGLRRHGWRHRRRRPGQDCHQLRLL